MRGYYCVYITNHSNSKPLIQLYNLNYGADEKNP